MYIEKIKSPKDVKAIAIDKLPILAEEVRSALLARVSNHGGHVGPNLGIVETTIAMHYVFNAPADKFVFDVSHQSYPHKLLTGRAFGFLNPDEYDKISGYSSPAESPEYDTFELGHTSTSIALATGLQKARDIKGGKENIVVVIGDGSLSGGEAFEGMNEATELGTNFILIVNDNEMSIAENHGGMYKNLKSLRESNGKAECNLFKAMGFDYIYQGNANNISDMIETFKKVKDIDHPIVIHIHTEKGHGFAPAIKDKERWHWSMPFDLETGESKVSFDGEDYSSITYDFLQKEMKKDPTIVAVTSATPTIAGFYPAQRKAAGKQHIDVGIAEEEAVAMISGMAKGGIHPVYNVYSTFLQRTYDQLAQDLCINKNPAVINVFAASIYGMNDLTHIGFYDIPMIGNIPNLVYLAPTCCEEYLAMEQWAITQNEHPVAIRVPAAVVHSKAKFDTDYNQLDRYEITQKGNKIAIVALGGFFQLGEAVVNRLKKECNIEATLINPRYITGLDTNLMEKLKIDHQLVVSLEDGVLEGGFGEKIARFFGPSSVKTLCFGIKKGIYDRYVVDELIKENHLTVEQIVDDINKVL
jgi:1-deoxy-D-xylulose-5-phosphate synthase